MPFPVLSGTDVLFMVGQLPWAAETHDWHIIIKHGTKTRCAGLWASSQIGHHALVEYCPHLAPCYPPSVSTCPPPVRSCGLSAHLPRCTPAAHAHLSPASVAYPGLMRARRPVYLPPPVLTRCPHSPYSPVPVPPACRTCGCRDGFPAEEQEGIAVLMPNARQGWGGAEREVEITTGSTRRGKKTNLMGRRLPGYMGNIWKLI